MPTKKHTKKKWPSSEAKQRDLALDKSWEDLKTRWETPLSSTPKKARAPYVPQPITVVHRVSGNQIPSLKAVNPPESCARPADKFYTGTKIIGLAVQHKSCIQPIFDPQAAVDSAKMRR